LRDLRGCGKIFSLLFSIVLGEECSLLLSERAVVDLDVVRVVDRLFAVAVVAGFLAGHNVESIKGQG
jgi:hypothetical protein